MTLATISRRSTNVTTAESMIEVIVPSTHFIRVKTVEVILTAATATSFGLGKPAVAGVTPTTPVAAYRLGTTLDPAPATTSALAWGTSPTPPSVYLRRASFPNVIGSRVAWDFPGEGLYIAPGESLVLQNIGATGACDINITFDEQPKQAS